MAKPSPILIWILVLLALCCSRSAAAQTAGVSKAEAEKRANAILSKMTLDEKLTLIGGINDFYTQAIPRVGVPALRMSDGPLGVQRGVR